MSAEQGPGRLISVLHQLFAQARKWQYRNITRQDILDSNPKAQKARELMGELPPSCVKQRAELYFLAPSGLEKLFFVRGKAPYYFTFIAKNYYKMRQKALFSSEKSTTSSPVNLGRICANRVPG